jgi:hypothetical protein
VVGIGTKKTTRALLLCGDLDDSKVTTISAYVGQRYSHKNETKVNPAGCWTLKRLAKRDRPVFQRVQSDCIRHVSPSEWRALFSAEAA